MSNPTTQFSTPTHPRGDKQADTQEQSQLVTFEFAEEVFAIDILPVQEINRMLSITCVPQSPACVEGVINLRGRIIPMLDLRKPFAMEPKGHGNESRIIVLMSQGEASGSSSIACTRCSVWAARSWSRRRHSCRPSTPTTCAAWAS